MADEQYKTLEELADDGLNIDLKMKTLKDELDFIKDTIKEKAQEQGVKTIIGDVAKAVISAQTSSTMDTVKFIEIAEANNVSQEGIAGALKVQIAQAKKVLGEEAYLPILVTKSNPYGVVKFTKLKKK
jgi:hypothetical protein